MGLFSADPPPPPKVDYRTELSAYDRRLSRIADMDRQERAGDDDLQIALERKARLIHEEIMRLDGAMADLRQDITVLRHQVLLLLNVMSQEAKRPDVEKLSDFVETLSPELYVTKDMLDAMLSHALSGEGQR